MTAPQIPPQMPPHSDQSPTNPAVIPPQPQNLPKPSSWWLRYGETIKILAVALVVALFLRGYVVEPRFIPSGSMEPSLWVGDRILVDKLTYHFKPLQRGDIVVFYPPLTAATPDNSKAYIKRLIAIGGDRVNVVDDQVFVNGSPLAEAYIAEPPMYRLRQEVTVPKDYYWVMGDNRNNSNDSHVWGFLPAQNIIGKAVLRFLPWDDRVGWLVNPFKQLPD
ncbi:MAG: signal peptidase I [Pseudanabaena sp. ELA607]